MKPLREIELKYCFSDRDMVTKLMNFQNLGPYQLGPYQVREDADTYYDTADHKLAQAGYALRYRQAQGQNMVQLKDVDIAESHLHTRSEWTIQTSRPTEPTYWPDHALARRVTDVIGDSQLVPLFRIMQQRHIASLISPADGAVAEVSIDDVKWIYENGTDEAWLLEIELLPGQRIGVMTDLQQLIQAIEGVQPLTETKYGHGIRTLKSAVD